MRILSILAYSPPSAHYGGAERQMHSLHKGLLKQGADVQVLADISRVASEYQKYEGVSIWGVPFPTTTSNPLVPGNIQFYRNWRKMLKLIRQKIAPIDLIQVTPLGLANGM
jgi:glycosyltransferase involved in cell wall biosynthesis